MWQKCFLSALYEEMDVFEKKGRGLGSAGRQAQEHLELNLPTEAAFNGISYLK